MRLLALLPLIAASIAAPALASPFDADARYQPSTPITLHNPTWMRDAVLYQVNVRQFTPDGTFRAAQGELPRLRALGVDVLWLMPVHPIGVANRKGTLGSPYSVRDYLGVNPEFGTPDDLRAFIDAAHAHGMRVILDWVANHSAWDNPLVTEHPEWYQRDWKGDFRPTPWWDWSDIINLDYRQPGLRKWMTRAMLHWVREFDVDGFRCDVAGFVPVDFWDNVRAELEAEKPVFMLAEWEARDLHARAFDATYAWSWYDAMHRIASGKADVNALYIYYSWHESAFPRGAMRMAFTSNHDKNAWEGTEFEAFGDSLEAATVLMYVGDHLPMIYNGMEAGNTRRLAFFEKDPITWREHPNGTLHQRLIALKSAYSPLWNGAWGAPMVHVPNDAPAHVLSFVRRDAAHQVFAVFNLSANARTVALKEGLYPGRYTDWASGATVDLSPDASLTLPAWGWKVFVR